MLRRDRRCFLRKKTAATAACITGRFLLAEETKPGPRTPYKRASTDWLAKCRFGFGVHWIAQTVPRSDPPKPFQRAVEGFDLEGFIKAAEYTGADYVLFTATHALQMLPAPHPVIDRILPGRTCNSH